MELEGGVPPRDFHKIQKKFGCIFLSTLLQQNNFFFFKSQKYFKICTQVIYLLVTRPEFNGGFSSGDIGTNKYHCARWDRCPQSGIGIGFFFQTFILVLLILIKAIFNNHNTSFLKEKHNQMIQSLGNQTYIFLVGLFLFTNK